MLFFFFFAHHTSCLIQELLASLPHQVEEDIVSSPERNAEFSSEMSANQKDSSVSEGEGDAEPMGQQSILSCAHTHTHTHSSYIHTVTQLHCSCGRFPRTITDSLQPFFAAYQMDKSSPKTINFSKLSFPLCLYFCRRITMVLESL